MGKREAQGKDRIQCHTYSGGQFSKEQLHTHPDRAPEPHPRGDTGLSGTHLFAILIMSELEKLSEKPCHPKGLTWKRHHLPLQRGQPDEALCLCKSHASGTRVAQHKPQPEPLSAPGTNEDPEQETALSPSTILPILPCPVEMEGELSCQWAS